MLESYEQEITRKRRAARVFWLIVFLFATFLYFFFQGYYPSMNLKNFRENLSGTGKIEEKIRNELIRSFGIVNIKTTPTQASIMLFDWETDRSGTLLWQDEKKMVNYGKYSLAVSWEGYLSGEVVFRIDQNTPFYIDTLTLVPNIQYNRIGSGSMRLVRSGTDLLEETGSGWYLRSQDFTGRTLISREKMRYIGEGIFLSGSWLALFSSEQGSFEKKIWSGSMQFLDECQRRVTIVWGKLFCPEKEKVLTEKWQSYTGIITIQKDFLRTRTHLIDTEAWTMLPLTSQESLRSFFLRKNTIWYMGSGGVLVPIRSQKKGSTLENIDTWLDQIRYGNWVDGMMIFIGTSGTGHVLSTVDPSGKKSPSIIPFPDISLDEIRIERRKGNLWIKTKWALLMTYHNSHITYWITTGDICAFSDNFAIYEKDGEIWKAQWREKEEQ